jgi:hypothetical protein
MIELDLEDAQQRLLGRRRELVGWVAVAQGGWARRDLGIGGKAISLR